jgi:predicted permease
VTSLTDRVREIRCAIRRLIAAPAFAIAGIAILALTFGVGTALFSVINSLVLRPMPFEERPGIIRISLGKPGDDLSGIVLPQPVADQLLFDGDFRSAALAGHARHDFSVSIGGHARVLLAEGVAGPYFQIVEARALAGRLLTPEDTDPAAPAVAVISERLLNLFREAGLEPINRTISVGGRHATVVGVVAASFPGLALRGVRTDVWLPAQDRRIHHVFGRLRAGATVAQADAEVKGRVSTQGVDARYRQHVIGVRDSLLGSSETMMFFFAGAAGLALCAVVVLVAGASVTNLCLARTSGRRAEIAIRLILGAETGDIRRLVSIEPLLLALAAGALSIGSATLTVRLIVDLIVRSDRVALNLQPDWRVLAYAGLVTFITVTVIGRIISSYASDIDALAAVSASAGAGGSTPQSNTVRQRLLAVQVGGSTMLLILAALLIRSASSGLSYAKGFNPVGAAVGWIDHRSQGHDDERARAMERRVLETARTTAGSANVAIASSLPFGAGLAVSLIADGKAQPLTARMTAVSSDFFTVFGLNLIRGRGFQDGEVSARHPVAVISESTALAMWPRSDPIGRRFRMADFLRLEREWTEYTVIGVVADTMATTGRLDRNGTVFVPYSGKGSVRFAILVRARGSAEASIQLLRASVTATSGDLALQNPSLLEDALESSRSERRTSGVLMTSIGLLAAGIALVGIYGLAAHAVNRRHREFGVLIALGATNRALMVGLALETGRTLVRGALFGIAASVPGAFLLRRYVWDLQPFDWLFVTTVPALLLTVGLAAAVLPLRTVIRRPVADLLKVS